MDDAVNSTSGGSLAIIGTVAVVAFLIFVIWEALHGLRRGLFRQLIHIGFMIVSAVIAFAVSASLWDGIFEAFGETTVEEMIAEFEASGEPIAEDVRTILLSFEPEVFECIIALPVGLLAMPFVFTLLFVVINLILKLAYFIVRLLLGIQKSIRLGGLAVGALEGALVACIMLFPFATLGDVAGDVVSIVEADADEETAATLAELKPLTDNSTFGFINAIGGRAIANRFCTLEIDGEKLNIRDDAILLTKTLISEGASLSETDWTNLNDEDKAALRAINSAISDSDYMATIVSGLLSGVCNALKNDPEMINIEPPFDSFIIAAFDIFSTSDKDNIGDDVSTILNIYFILSDEGVLSAGENADTVELLTKKNAVGDTVIDRIIVEIKSNERTKPLITSLTKLSLSVLSNQLGLGADATQLYSDVKSDINEKVLSVSRDNYNGDEQAYMDALSSSLDTTLKEYDIVLEEEIVDGIAEYVDSEYIQKGVTEFSDEEFNDVILSYYDHYLEYIENQGGAE